MSLTAEMKVAIVNKYKTSEGDTGSPQVQIALLTARIQYLTDHMKANKHDYHSRRGLLRLVNQRRKLLSYYKVRNLAGYRDLVAELDLRG
jgi:small subunit ribosomal protein S15